MRPAYDQARRWRRGITTISPEAGYAAQRGDVPTRWVTSTSGGALTGGYGDDELANGPELRVSASAVGEERVQPEMDSPGPSASSPPFQWGGTSGRMHRRARDAVLVKRVRP